MFFVPGNSVAFHQIKKVPRAVTGQRRTAEVRIARNKLRGRSTNIGEVATPPARDTYFLCQLLGVIDQHNLKATLACHCGGHHAGSAGTNNRHIKTRPRTHAMDSSLMQST